MRIRYNLLLLLPAMLLFASCKKKHPDPPQDQPPKEQAYYLSKMRFSNGDSIVYERAKDTAVTKASYYSKGKLDHYFVYLYDKNGKLTRWDRYTFYGTKEEYATFNFYHPPYNESWERWYYIFKNEDFLLIGYSGWTFFRTSSPSWGSNSLRLSTSDLKSPYLRYYGQEEFQFDGSGSDILIDKYSIPDDSTKANRYLPYRTTIYTYDHYKNPYMSLPMDTGSAFNRSYNNVTSYVEKDSVGTVLKQAHITYTYNEKGLPITMTVRPDSVVTFSYIKK